MIKKFIYFIIICLITLVSVMIWNMNHYVSKQMHFPITDKVEINKELAIRHLSEAINFKTISNVNHENIDAISFLSFQKFLRRNYPLTFSQLTERIFSGYSILLKWEGINENPHNPILLMAHMDVVPAEELDKWSEDPFSGLDKDNYIWGRGTIDDKSSLISILESIEYLLSIDYKPIRDIYISFGHDEENTGVNGNFIIADSLKNDGIYFDMVLDEGSIISNGIIKGADRPVAVVGVAEKGYVSIQLTCTFNSGHSSMPENTTTIGKLSKAIARLERYQMKSSLISPIRNFFSYLGPELQVRDRFIFSNIYLLSSSIINELEKESVTAAMVRTTTAPTLINSGLKSNILPSEAKAVVNFRIRQGDNIKKVKKHVVEVINDSDIKVNILSNELSSEPSKVSSSDSHTFNLIHKTIKEIFGNVIVAPGLVIGATDSRHFQSISKNIYRFLPLELSSEDLKMIHGYNEKIPKDSFMNMIQFYIQLIRNFDDI